MNRKWSPEKNIEYTDSVFPFKTLAPGYSGSGNNSCFALLITTEIAPFSFLELFLIKVVEKLFSAEK